MEGHEGNTLFVRTCFDMLRFNLARVGCSVNGMLPEVSSSLALRRCGVSTSGILKMNGKVYMFGGTRYSFKGVYEYHAADNSLTESKDILPLPSAMGQPTIFMIADKFYVLELGGGANRDSYDPSPCTFAVLDTSSYPAKWNPLPKPLFITERGERAYKWSHFVVDRSLFLVFNNWRYRFDSGTAEWTSLDCFAPKLPDHYFPCGTGDVWTDDILVCLTHRGGDEGPVCPKLQAIRFDRGLSIVGFQELDAEEVGIFGGLNLHGYYLTDLGGDKKNLCAIGIGKLRLYSKAFSDSRKGICISIFQIDLLWQQQDCNNSFSVDIKKQYFFTLNPNIFMSTIEDAFLLHLPEPEEEDTSTVLQELRKRKVLDFGTVGTSKLQATRKGLDVGSVRT